MKPSGMPHSPPQTSGLYTSGGASDSGDVTPRAGPIPAVNRSLAVSSTAAAPANPAVNPMATISPFPFPCNMYPLGSGLTIVAHRTTTPKPTQADTGLVDGRAVLLKL